MMLDVFRGLKNILKVNRVHTDGSVFRLHYHATVMILIAFSVIVTTKQFVGNPIECNHSKDVSEAVINAYCWITSTHTIVTDTSYNPQMIKSLVNEVGKINRPKHPYPGIGPDIILENGKVKYHKYYQWVCFMLFFQAVLFYIPRWLWKNWEGGKIQALIMDLNVSVCTEAEKKQKKKLLLDYLWCNLCHHNWWAWRYFFCELLCFVNVIGQLFLMDRFLDGQFMEYGIKVVTFLEDDQSTRVDPMVFVFPRVTKCSFFKYGGSGSVETHDAICILPLNVVNEKIYIFLWFWFMVLAGLTSLVLLFRILIVFFPPIRILLLQMRFRLLPREQIKALVSKSKIGDWFLFYMLGQNVDTLIFRDIFNDLTCRVELNGSEPAV